MSQTTLQKLQSQGVQSAEAVHTASKRALFSAAIQSDKTSVDATAPNKASQFSMNFKCPSCDRDLDGSFRMMTHIHCGIRYCAAHLQDLVASKKLCSRCRIELRKEELICTPSLSQSQREGFSQPKVEPLSRPTPPIAPQIVVVTSELLYECPICNLKGLSHSQLLDHSKMHANVPGKCPVCEKRDSKDYFSNHLYGHLMLRHKIKNSAGHLPPDGGKSRLVATLNQKSQVQTANQTLVQASKGLQQANHSKLADLLSGTAQQAGAPQLSNSQLVVKERRNVNLTIGEKHSAPKLSTPSAGSQLQNAAFASSQLLGSLTSMVTTQAAQPIRSDQAHSQLIKRKQRSGTGQRVSLTTAPSLAQMPTNFSNLHSTEQLQANVGKWSVASKGAGLRLKVAGQQTAHRPFAVQSKMRSANTVDVEEPRLLHTAIASKTALPSEWLSQGLIGVFAFSMDPVSSDLQVRSQKASDDARKLRLTSQYLSKQHKHSLLKQSCVAGQASSFFKLMDIEKYLKVQTRGPEQDHAKDQASTQSDGLSAEDYSSDSSGLDRSFQDAAMHSTLDYSTQSLASTQKNRVSKGSRGKKRKGGQGNRSKASSGRLSVDLGKSVRSRASAKPAELNLNSKMPSTKKEGAALQVPIYLREIQRICFPQSMPSSQKVVLQKDSKLAFIKKFDQSNDQLRSDHSRPEESKRKGDPGSSSTKKLFSFSPLSNTWSDGVRPAQNAAATSSFYCDQTESNADEKLYREQSEQSECREKQEAPSEARPRQNVSPRSHFGTPQIRTLCQYEYPLCTLEMIERYHQRIFYTTRTADDKVRHLSILVCAQPQVVTGSLAKSRDDIKLDISDAMISEEDETEWAGGVIARLQPFVLVIANERESHASGLGAAMLDFLYAKCFRPFYHKICFPSTQLSKQLELFKIYANDSTDTNQNIAKAFELMSLGAALGVAFELLNVFVLNQEDAYRCISWKDPLAQSRSQLLSVNAMFQGRQCPLLNCSFSVRHLLRELALDDLIKLYSCLLLEKKVVLVANDETHQAQLSPLIEALLALMEPLDSQVFSNVSYTLTDDMIFCMEKPGAIIMGMPKKLWLAQGKRLFHQSFDNYIVVFDLEERVFHLKTEREVIGLPQPFAKLLRRSLTALDKSGPNLYVALQTRQAFFNNLLLMLVQAESLQQQETERKMKLRALGVTDAASLALPQAVSSQATAKEAQFPQSQQFFTEFRGMTTYIDLREKLDRKDVSVAFVSECLQIIESQKIDWFARLLSFQQKHVGPDLLHLAPILTNIQPSFSFSSKLPKKDLSFEQIERILEPQKSLSLSKQIDVTVCDFKSMADVFKINKRLVSKTLRTTLFQNQQTQQVTLNEKACGMRFDSRRNFGSASTSNALNEGLLSSFLNKSDVLSKATTESLPNNLNFGKASTPSKSKMATMQGRRSPKTPSGLPDGIARPRSLFEDADAPPSTTRAARYGSTHKPQIAFKQVRSSQSPRREPREETEGVGEPEETKLEEEIKQEKPAQQTGGGFLSMITNFFSSSRQPLEESKKQQKDEVSLQEAKEELKGRKSSKSMQVVQPLSKPFAKPLDIQEVTQIKNLASGLSLLQKINEHQQSAHAPSYRSNQTQIQALKDLPKATPGLRKNDTASAVHEVLHASRQRSDKQALEQQVTATFKKEPGFQSESTRKQASSPRSLTSAAQREERRNFSSGHVISELRNFLEANSKLGVQDRHVEPFSTRVELDYERRLSQADTPGFKSEHRLAGKARIRVDSRQDTLSQVQSEALAVQGITSLEFQPMKPSQKYLENDSQGQIVAPQNTAHVQREAVEDNQAQSLTKMRRANGAGTYKKDVMLGEMPDQGFQSSARDSSDPTSLSISQDAATVAGPACSSSSLTNGSVSYARVAKMLPEIESEKATGEMPRHSCPFPITASPNSKMTTFQSALKEDAATLSAKRLSLNAVQLQKGSLQMIGLPRTQAQGGHQPQKSIRTAKINLNQKEKAANESRNQLIGATATESKNQMSGSGSSQQISNRTHEIAFDGNRPEQSALSSNKNCSQKLKITIN